MPQALRLNLDEPALHELAAFVELAQLQYQKQAAPKGDGNTPDFSRKSA
jgi:hypothetical protein